MTIKRTWTTFRTAALRRIQVAAFPRPCRRCPLGRPPRPPRRRRCRGSAPRQRRDDRRPHARAPRTRLGRSPPSVRGPARARHRDARGPSSRGRRPPPGRGMGPHRRNARLRARLLAALPMLAAAEIRVRTGARSRNPSKPASRWKRESRVLAVPHNGADGYPAFQFDAANLGSQSRDGGQADPRQQASSRSRAGPRCSWNFPAARLARASSSISCATASS